MVEIKPSGKLVTPSVWDLHLHHVVWLAHGGPTFASGEEKTIAKMPQGYGFKVGGDANWGLNYMIHNLDASEDRAGLHHLGDRLGPGDDAGADRHQRGARSTGSTSPARRRSTRSSTPSAASTTNGDGKFVFPDEVPTDPSLPGYEERAKISHAAPVDGPAAAARRWSSAPATCIPGGEHVDLQVARDGPDAGTHRRRRPGRDQDRCSAPTPSTTSPPAR